MKKVDFYIKHLKLKVHPEGGYFNEVYRSDEVINSLPERYTGSCSVSTSIYFLLKGDHVSNLHRLKSDEIWHFYDGSPVRIYFIDNQGNLKEIVLGRSIENGETLQAVIKKEHWFCAEVADKNSFALTGCTVAPGFDFSDFEFGRQDELIKNFPEHKTFIERFTILT